MTWITMGKAPVTSHPGILVMLRDAVAASPGEPRRQRALARELHALADQRGAIDAFERLLAITGDLAGDWPSFALATLDIEGADAALELCARRWHGRGTADWHYVNAQALRALGRIGDAEADLRRAIALGDPDHDALRALLRMHAERSDGAALLAACDSLPIMAPGLGAGVAGIGAVRGYRALALSLLGRDDEANALVDLDAGTMRFRFEPPAGTTLEAFNDALATAILADQPADTAHHDILINHAIHLPASAELTALRAFIEASYADYVAHNVARHPGPGFMPPITGATSLDYGAVTIRRQGRNGQHVHPAAYLTGVYHVRVPVLADGGRQAGALVTGVCDEIAPGHRACWGHRVLPAVPGILTIFPAHYFHDVRPTGVEAQRVVVVADLMPA